MCRSGITKISQIQRDRCHIFSHMRNLNKERQHKSTRQTIRKDERYGKEESVKEGNRILLKFVIHVYEKVVVKTTMQAII